MDRHAFHKLFRSPGPVVTPVIHVLDFAQAARNVAVAVRAGAAGVFLINHDFEAARLVPILREVRQRWPGLWLGVNFLAVTGRDAFPILGKLEAEGCPVDAYWADDARMDERFSRGVFAASGTDVVSAATTAPVSSNTHSLSVIAALITASCHSKGIDRPRDQRCQ